LQEGSRRSRRGVNQQPFRHAGGMPACGCSSVLSPYGRRPPVIRRLYALHRDCIAIASLRSAAHE
jgi:hypothetical protein